MDPGQKIFFDAGNPLLAQGKALMNGGVVGGPGEEIPLELAPPLDTGNPLLAPVDVRLESGTMWTPGAIQLAVLTWYSPSTTHTVFLPAADLKTWAAKYAGIAAHVHGARVGVIVVCSATTRFTMYMAAPDFAAHTRILAGLAASMSGSGLVIAQSGSARPPTNGNGRPPRPGLNGKSG